MPGSEIRREIIAPALLRQLTMLIAYIEPGQSSFNQPDAHHGEECLHVLTGQLTAQVGGQTTVLDEGDTLYFDARLPHEFRNDGDADVQVLVALLYPPGPPRPTVNGRWPANVSPVVSPEVAMDTEAAGGRRPARVSTGAKPGTRRQSG